jgi:hypothetical protein
MDQCAKKWATRQKIRKKMEICAAVKITALSLVGWSRGAVESRVRCMEHEDRELQLSVGNTIDFGGETPFEVCTELKITL